MGRRDGHSLQLLDARCLLRVEVTLAPYGDKWLGQGPADVIESAWPGSVALVQFPSREAADGLGTTRPTTKLILRLRTRNTISDIILVDQLPEAFTVKCCAAAIRGVDPGRHPRLEPRSVLKER